MNHKRLLLCIALILELGLIGLLAQESVLVSGGNATGVGGKTCYSIGQVLYNINTGTTGSVTQGVQQPFEISNISGINGLLGINLLISSYPNPTSDFLILKIENIGNSKLSYQLYNIKGELVQSKKIEDCETRIVMCKLLPSTYFIKVNEGKKELKTFKIIKN